MSVCISYRYIVSSIGQWSMYCRANYRPTVAVNEKLTSLKLTVAATALKLQKWHIILRRGLTTKHRWTPLRVQAKSYSNSSALMLGEATHLVEYEYCFKRTVMFLIFTSDRPTVSMSQT